MSAVPGSAKRTIGSEGEDDMGVRPAVVALGLILSAASSASGQTLDKKVLSFAAAQRIAATAADAARARGVGVVIAVVDDGGHLILLHRLDDTQVASVNVGIGKARTAAVYRRPSRELEEQIRAGRIAALALADSTPLQGGVPILLNGKVIGAIGVSGDTPQVDEAIAMAGAAAFAPVP
jgi:glc operon protein GlcG